MNAETLPCSLSAADRRGGYFPLSPVCTHLWMSANPPWASIWGWQIHVSEQVNLQLCHLGMMTIVWAFSFLHPTPPAPPPPHPRLKPLLHPAWINCTPLLGDLSAPGSDSPGRFPTSHLGPDLQVLADGSFSLHFPSLPNSFSLNSVFTSCHVRDVSP